MASLTFPSSPSNGDTYTYDGLTYVYSSAKNKWSVQSTSVIGGVDASSINTNFIPSANVTYDLGTASNAFRDLYLSGSSINLGGQTITASANGIVLPEGSQVGGITLGTGGATQYANATSLPTSGLTAGQFAFVGNTLFMTNGSGWYSVALINQSPELTINTNSITLGDSGNTINFTYTATDPDGPSPTVTVSSDLANTDSANITLYTSNSTVTVQNLSNTNYNANITLTATDGINQTYGVVTLNVIFVTTIYKHPLWDETVLSVGTSSTNGLQNSTFIDRSTNARTVTPTGAPVQNAFHPYLDNWSVFLHNGIHLYVDNVDATVQWGTGDFTVEFWAYFPATHTSNQTVFERNTTGTNDTNNRIIFGMTPSGNVRLWATGTEHTTNTAIPIGQWNHIALVRNSGTAYLYMNGSLGYSFAYAHNFNGADTVFTIGKNRDNAEPVQNLNLSNLRVTSDAVYTSAFTPPTENLTNTANTDLLVCQSNRFVDNSSNSFSFTHTNAIIQAFNPFGQDSEYVSGENKGSTLFDATDDFLYTLDTGIVLNSEFTIESWVYMNDTTNSALFTQKASVGVISTTKIHSDGFYMQIYGGNRGNLTGTLSRDNTDLLNRWSHIAVEWTGSAFEYFVDGISIGTHPITTNWHYSGIDYYTQIGVYDYSGPNSHFNGYMADFKVTAGSRVYGSNFTPPTAPVGNTNASLYLPMDNAGIYDKTGNHTVTLNGNVLTSTTQTKFANSSMYFDGSGDWVSLNGLEAIGTNDFTIETWVYPTASGSSPYVFDFREVAASVAPALAFQNGTLTYISQNLYVITTSQSIQLNTWAHVAVVRSSGTTTVYYNGTNVGSVADSRVYIASNGRIGKYGAGDAGYFVGYMENFQIYNNYAKYTANFTPPTQSQGIGYQAES